ncbi:DUF3667 domain-containing protein [Dokdonia sp. Asnod3-C12]|uniref:DUF3667 domain-containing protein n=1 Tax=Dokdonia sp. Asnod3-C12 TaxID=3160575 RepID=UPI00386A399B
MSKKPSDNSKLDKKSSKLAKKIRDVLVVSDHCKNCGTPLQLDQRFCSHCGAKRMYNRLNTRNLLEDFTERFLNIENVFLKTFIVLFTAPEDVIHGYVEGLRKRYMSAFGYFAVALTITSVYTFFFRNWFIDSESFSEFSNGFASGFKSPDTTVLNDYMDFVFDYQSLFSFLCIPLYAVISKLVFWNYKQYNFIEHIVIYLYTYSQVQILMSVLGMLFIWSNMAQMILGVVTTVFPIIYTIYVLYRIFDLTIEKAILKTILFLAILLPLSCLFMSAVGGIMYTTGMLDEFVADVKQQSEIARAAREAAVKAKDSIRVDSVKAAVQIVKDTLN